MFRYTHYKCLRHLSKLVSSWLWRPFKNIFFKPRFIVGETYINTVYCLTPCFCWIFSDCLLCSLKGVIFQMYWCGDVRNKFANKQHCMSKMVKHWIVLPCKCAVWRSDLLIEEIGVSGENQRPVASHWQTLSHNVVSSTTRLVGGLLFICGNRVSHKL